LNKNSDEKKVMPYIVTFLDLLGTKDRIHEAKGYDDLDIQLNKLIKAIGKNIGLLQGIQEIFEGHLTIFSDSIIMSTPLISDPDTRKPDLIAGELVENIIYVAGFQYGMFNDGFILCGGIACDFGFFNDSISFGPALNEAYNVVNESNNLPAILCENNVKKWINLIKEQYHNHPQNGKFNWILSDNEGNHFINYLYFIIVLAEFNADMNNETFIKNNIFSLYPPAEKELIYHKKIIEKNLSNEKLQRKYKWLASYHNFFCNNYLPEGDRFLIDSPTTYNFKIVA